LGGLALDLLQQLRRLRRVGRDPPRLVQLSVIAPGGRPLSLTIPILSLPYRTIPDIEAKSVAQQMLFFSAVDAKDLMRDGIGTERWFDCLVAVTAAGIVGYAMTCRGYEAHIGKRRLWLSDLFVRKQARRIGVGRALMIAVAREAIARGCEAVYWDLWRRNVIGKFFYESLGATEINDLAIWRVSSRDLSVTGDGLPTSIAPTRLK
jgi:GNAT superfamily N-acetyltransferase